MGCNSSVQVGLENVNKKPVSICVLGLLNSGKTSIVEYLAGEYNANDPPIHTNGVLLRDLSVHNVLFRLYDIGSFGTSDTDIQESINSSNAAIYVIDGHTFEYNLKAINELFTKSSPYIAKKRLPIVIIINKVSEETIESCQDPIKKVVESYFGSEIKKKYIKMSKLGDQIFPAFQWLYDTVQQSSD